MPFGADLALSAIPVAGALGAAAIQRQWALKDWHRVNEYNKPINQIARLKEANLPLAAMFTGSGGSTSTDVGQTQIDPTLGTARGLETYFQNRMQRKQLQMMDEQIGKAAAEKVISQVAANKALDEDRYYREALYDEKGYLRIGNRRTDSLALSMREQEAKTKTAEVMAELSRAKTQADIDHILATIGLSKQQFAYNEAIQFADKWISGRLQRGEVTALEALIYKFFLKR